MSKRKRRRTEGRRFLMLVQRDGARIVDRMRGAYTTDDGFEGLILELAGGPRGVAFYLIRRELLPELAGIVAEAMLQQDPPTPGGRGVVQ